MLTAIAAIVSIVAVLGSAGVTVAGIVNNIKNQELRSGIQSAITTVTQQLKSGRLSVSKLLSLLQGKNAAALQQYLYSNPMVSKSFNEIQADADLIAGYQAEANHIENLISQYQAELSSLGYSSSIFGLEEEERKKNAAQARLDEAVEQHKRLEQKIAGTRMTMTRPTTFDTSHLDAVSQNLAGGMKS